MRKRGGSKAEPTKPSPGSQGLEADCGPAAALEIEFPSCPEYLSLLRYTSRWYARRCGFNDRECGRIALALVEAVTNIIRHAYEGDERQRILLRMAECEGGVEFEFLDQGKSVVPSALEIKTREKLEPGGLGVRMMKTCMDHFQYEPRPGGGSRLVLRKLRGQDGAEPGK